MASEHSAAAAGGQRGTGAICCVKGSASRGQSTWTVNDPKRSHNIDCQFSSFRTLGDLSGVVETGRHGQLEPRRWRARRTAGRLIRQARAASWSGSHTPGPLR